MKIRDMITITIWTVLFTACDPIDDVIKPDRIYGPLTYFSTIQFAIIDNPINLNDKLLGIITAENGYGLLRDDTLGNVISCTNTDGTLRDSICLYSQDHWLYDSLGNEIRCIYIIHTDTSIRKNTCSIDTMHFSLSNHVRFGGVKDRPFGDKKHNIPTYIFKRFGYID